MNTKNRLDLCRAIIGSALLLALWVGCGTFAQAATIYYVDVDGADNILGNADDGSDSYDGLYPTPRPFGVNPNQGPFATIQKAADTIRAEISANLMADSNWVQPAYTVYVRAGTYYPVFDRADRNVLTIAASGTSAKAISFCPYQNEVVTLSEDPAHTTSSRMSLILIQGDYIIFDGFRVDHWKGRGIEVNGGDHFTIQNIEIFDSHSPADYYVGWGIFVRRANGGLIKNNHIYHNQAGIIVSAPDLDYVEGVVSDVIVERNYVHDNHARQVANDNDSDGIEVASGSRGVIIRNNVVHNNGDDGIDIFMSYDAKVINNVSYNHSQWGNGNGFKSNTGGGGNHLFVGNISFGNSAHGFNLETDSASRPAFSGLNYGNLFYHNYAFNNQMKGLVTGSTTERIETDYIAKNNIIFNNHLAPGETIEYRHIQSASSIGGAVSDYNIWGDQGLNTPSYVEGSQSDLNVDDPSIIQFADFSNIAVVTDLNSADFGKVIGLELTAGSPAIDRGTFALLTTASGTTSLIPVNDDPTKYFRIGDTIQIENAGRATILDMDAPAQTITTASPLSFASAAGVHWPWAGSAPDRGATEYLSGLAPGDVSTNGAVSAYDAALVLQHLAGLISLSAEQLQAADINGDTLVDAADAAMIAQTAAGLI